MRRGIVLLLLIGLALLQLASCTQRERIVLAPTHCDATPLPNVAQNDQWLVGAYFYPWYGDPNDIGQHWGQSVGHPSLGTNYNSSDPDVICRQINLASGHGVDFFAVSWWGEGSFGDQVLRDNLLKNKRIDSIRFAILYESQGRLGDATTLNPQTIETMARDLQYLERTYFNDPHYLKIDNRPVVFLYTTRGFTPTEMIPTAMKEIRDRLTSNVYLVADQYQWEVPMDENVVGAAGFDAVTAYMFKPTNFQDTDTFVRQYPDVLGQRTREAQRAKSSSVPNVFPASHAATRQQQLVPRMDGSQFKSVLREALKFADPANGRMVMLTSWNEWHEDTSIEPATEFGELYLNALQEVLHDARAPVVGLDSATATPIPTPARSKARIAFSSNRDGNDEIYVMNADGSGQTNLTNNPASDYGAAWSPDGTKIAFCSDRDGNGELYVMNADGSGQTNLTRHPGEDYGAAWSPDGTRIAFVSTRDGPQNSEIYVMNADGSGQTNLTNRPEPDDMPRWAPANRIVFAAWNADLNYDIYVMNADGSQRTRLTNSPAHDWTPTWSPDGSRIAFLSQRSGNGDLYVMNADGSNQVALTNSPAVDHQPAWSPDGTQIAFSSERDGNNEIYVMNTDGSGQTNLSNNPASDTWPVWSQ